MNAVALKKKKLSVRESNDFSKLLCDLQTKSIMTEQI